jgi:predicted Zn-dependent protease
MVRQLFWRGQQGWRKLGYSCLSILVALAIWVGVQQKTTAFSIFDLLFQGIQIIQLSNISDDQEVSIGRDINQQITADRQAPILRDAAISDYLNEIGQRLAATSDRPNIPYTFQVVADRQINAFATMGGFVYINAGLIAAADNEAQLASVVAHEIGHIAARHVIERLKQTAITRGLATAAGLDQSTLVGLGIELALNLPNSREAEFQSDRLGLENLIRAGYAPSAMPAFMTKLMSANSPPTFLSSHPAVGDRIQSLENAIDPQDANIGDGLSTAEYRRRISSLL